MCVFFFRAFCMILFYFPHFDISHVSPYFVHFRMRIVSWINLFWQLCVKKRKGAKEKKNKRKKKNNKKKHRYNWSNSNSDDKNYREFHHFRSGWFEEEKQFDFFNFYFLFFAFYVYLLSLFVSQSVNKIESVCEPSFSKDWARKRVRLEEIGKNEFFFLVHEHVCELTNGTLCTRNRSAFIIFFGH